MKVAELVHALRERGVVASDAPLIAVESDRPWFLALLLGIAGWIAGVFVIVFLTLALGIQSAKDLLPPGIVLLGVAAALYFVARSKVFVDQLALALSIAGQLAIATYFGVTLDDPVPAIAAILVLQLLVFVVMPDRVARTLAVLFASIAWVLIVRIYLRPNEGSDVFIDAAGHVVAPLLGAWTLPIEWLASWLPLIALVLWLRVTETAWMGRAVAALARPAITGLLLALALGGIAAEPESLLSLNGAGMGRQFDLWALFPLFSIALALFVAYTAFQLRSAGLSGLAIVAALAHLARFYYLYGTTLTLKSMIMFAVGLVLLGAGRLLGRHAGETP
jgi:hypothetical protein